MTIGQNAIGANFTDPLTLGTAVDVYPEFELGTHMKGDAGREYVYVRANGAITANDVVFIDENHQADQLDTTNSASAFGRMLGVAPATFADDQYGWIQIKGACTLNVGSACAANTQLNSTGTAGRVDDDGTAGSEVAEGLATTGIESSNTAAGWLNYPRVGATL
ncbi:MAG: hypothetical protein AAF982_03890 [Pseudomonadota bacterium]